MHKILNAKEFHRILNAKEFHRTSKYSNYRFLTCDINDQYAYIDRNKIEGRSLAESRALINKRVKYIKTLERNRHPFNKLQHAKCVSGSGSKR